MNSNNFLEDLNYLSTEKIYFGHQSVGRNIIAGLKRILDENPGSQFRILSLEEAITDTSGFFTESNIGKNGKPNTKCDAFENTIEEKLSGNIDYALMKFCYVDIDTKTNIDEMFEYYSKMMEVLKTKFPSITFIHVTVPLSTRGPWWKRTFKNILGKDDFFDIVNCKRTSFNERIIAHYKNEPVFDIARVESTYPNGTRESYEMNGKICYSLVNDYTNDGGHLNENGQRIVAEELINTLVRVSKK